MTKAIIYNINHNGNNVAAELWQLLQDNEPGGKPTGKNPGVSREEFLKLIQIDAYSEENITDGSDNESIQ